MPKVAMHKTLVTKCSKELIFPIVSACSLIHLSSSSCCLPKHLYDNIDKCNEVVTAFCSPGIQQKVKPKNAPIQNKMIQSALNTRRRRHVQRQKSSKAWL